jgi:uncharacterized membrane protein
MANSDGAERRGMPVGRMEALTDAVLAIVITLLVLEIEPPPEGMSSKKLYQALLEDWHMFIAYIISFAILCLYWWRHHILFHYLNQADGTLTVLNLVFLFFVALIPFPTALLVEYFETPDAEIAVLIFGVVNLICSGFFLAMWFYATRQRLVKDILEASAIKRLMESLMIGPVVYLMAILTSFYSATTALLLFLLVPLLHVLPRYLSTHEVILYEY